MTPQNPAQQDNAGNPQLIRRKKKPLSRRGSPQKGKLWLIVIFFSLVAIDWITYFSFPKANRHHLQAPMINNLIWYFAFLAGIWKRKNWARYIFIVILILGVIAFVIFAPDVLINSNSNSNHYLPSLFFANGILRVVIIWFLITSLDIQRLVKRTYD